MIKFGPAPLFFLVQLCSYALCFISWGYLIVLIISPSYDFKICLMIATSR